MSFIDRSSSLARCNIEETHGMIDVE